MTIFAAYMEKGIKRDILLYWENLFTDYGENARMGAMESRSVDGTAASALRIESGCLGSMK
jgi:hypothetical protein